MCTAKFIYHPKCKHWSSEIADACREGKNFSNCKTFEEGRCRNIKYYKKETAKEGECPKCDKEDDYDGEKIRMVRGVQHGYRLGLGPNETDLGMDFLSPKGLSKKKRKDEAPEYHVIRCNVM